MRTWVLILLVAAPLMGILAGCGTTPAPPAPGTIYGQVVVPMGLYVHLGHGWGYETPQHFRGHVTFVGTKASVRAAGSVAGIGVFKFQARPGVYRLGAVDTNYMQRTDRCTLGVGLSKGGNETRITTIRVKAARVTPVMVLCANPAWRPGQQNSVKPF